MCAVLKTAANFAVIGSETVTNTGLTYLYGDVGVYPGENAILPRAFTEFECPQVWALSFLAQS